MGFPGDSVNKESACNVGDLDSIPGLGRSLGEGNGNPLQYSCLETLWTEESGGLQFMGLQGVGLDWACMHEYLPFLNMGSGILSSQCLPQCLAPSKQLKKCLLIMCMNEWWVKEMWSNQILWPAQDRINYSMADLILESRLPEYDTTFDVMSFLSFSYLCLSYILCLECLFFSSVLTLSQSLPWFSSKPTPWKVEIFTLTNSHTFHLCLLLYILVPHINL